MILFWILGTVVAGSVEVHRSRACAGYEVQPVFSVYKRGNARSKAGYTAEEIDVLVVHIGPRDVWYVIPVAAFASLKNLRFLSGY